MDTKRQVLTSAHRQLCRGILREHFEARGRYELPTWQFTARRLEQMAWRNDGIRIALWMGLATRNRGRGAVFNPQSIAYLLSDLAVAGRDQPIRLKRLRGGSQVRWKLVRGWEGNLPLTRTPALVRGLLEE